MLGKLWQYIAMNLCSLQLPHMPKCIIQSKIQLQLHKWLTHSLVRTAVKWFKKIGSSKFQLRHSGYCRTI